LLRQSSQLVPAHIWSPAVHDVVPHPVLLTLQRVRDARRVSARFQARNSHVSIALRGFPAKTTESTLYRSYVVRRECNRRALSFVMLLEFAADGNRRSSQLLTGPSKASVTKSGFVVSACEPLRSALKC